MGAVCVAGFLRLFLGPKRRGKDDSQLGVFSRVFSQTARTTLFLIRVRPLVSLPTALVVALNNNQKKVLSLPLSLSFSVSL